MHDTVFTQLKIQFRAKQDLLKKLDIKLEVFATARGIFTAMYGLTNLGSNIWSNLVPKVFHLTAWSERGKTLEHAGHVSPRILEMTIK